MFLGFLFIKNKLVEKIEKLIKNFNMKNQTKVIENEKLKFEEELQKRIQIANLHFSENQSEDIRNIKLSQRV
jgi:ribosomal protein L18E